LNARIKWHDHLPIEGPIFAYFEFHFPNRHALPDTSNCIEGPQDLLESLGIYKNDQAIEHIEAIRVLGSKAKTVIKLFVEKVDV
jgi:Holliday junction resolvase RusA-like endonuclease